jgi:hypothetical protein
MGKAETMDSAEYAPSARAVAPAEAFDLREYSFNGANGEPEGCEFAESFEEACRVWGMDLSNGECRLMQVWQRSEEKWFRIERTAHGVEAREVAV